MTKTVVNCLFNKQVANIESKEWHVGCLLKCTSCVLIMIFFLSSMDLRAISEKHGEKFHQNMSEMELRYETSI